MAIKKTITTQSHDNIPSQKKRWAMYGLNVAILIAAMLVILILINWISYRHYARFDFTATRRYSLSNQTISVLTDLITDVRVYTLFDRGTGRSGATRQQQKDIDDLLAEYVRSASGRITLESIDSAYDMDAFNQLTQQLCDRYSDEMSSTRKIVCDALKLTENLVSFLNIESDIFKTSATRFYVADDTTATILERISEVLASQAENPELATAVSNARNAINEPMPNYFAAWSVLSPQLETICNGNLRVLTMRLRTMSESGTPNEAIRVFLENKATAFEAMLADIDDTVSTLADLQATEYDMVRHKVFESNVILIMTDTRLTVFSMNDAYVQPPVDDDMILPDQLFKGEEAITARLIGLTLDQPPKVVFVGISPPDFLGPEGCCSHVADILQSMSFEVVQWNPIGVLMDGKSQRSEPEPIADPDQAMVYVIAPDVAQVDQGKRMEARLKIAEALKIHLRAGRSALIFAGLDSLARFGQADPVATVLEQYGIRPRVDQMILTEYAQGRSRVPSSQMNISSWPDEHIISRMMKGLTGVHYQAIPLDITGETDNDITRWSLAESSADTWAETDWYSKSVPSRGENEESGPLVTIAAAEADGQRIVVIGDPFWALDKITQNNVVVQTQAGEVLRYTKFPANTEMFVNSIYWLTGLDELIARSARTQDIRRFEPITRSGIIIVGWVILAGLPAFCLMAGVAVWFVRRK